MSLKKAERDLEKGIEYVQKSIQDLERFEVENNTVVNFDERLRELHTLLVAVKVDMHIERSNMAIRKR